ncbi:methyl-accepting chemotaxis protein [Chitinispirillales bacterium ANBcel5]|uniref:HAMP domain-containing methyl-accepting chemotaxis protein n=1 Tax=Cellulosispirillum alkaliphilum TaxID=3039283 RepID=UPI002A4EE39D|nr:methyl-accepting chemotaxis protein [Chitinispirillales bacterium ANBcel5]
MKLSLRARLLVSYVVIIVGLLIVSLVFVLNVNNVRQTLVNVFEGDFRPYQALTQGDDYISEWIEQIETIEGMEPTEQLNELQLESQELYSEIRTIVTEVMNLPLTDFGRAILVRLSENIESLNQLRQQMINAVRGGEVQIIELLKPEVEALAQEIDRDVSEFLEFQENHFLQQIENAEEDVFSAVVLMVAIIVIVLVLAIVTIISTYRIVSTSVKKVVKSAQELSVSSNEIVATTSQLTSNSVQTSTAVNQVTSTVEETRQTARISNDKAKYVSESAQNVYHVSTNGKQVIEKTISAMSDIQQEMNQVAQGIIKLSEQSQMVGQITDTVNDLADATNVLSVNASIEAARAGEHGRGFSVVAEEIRNLAERSKQATLRIREILSDIQKATNATVLTTEQASKKVEQGVMQSKQAGETIEVLSSNITEAAQASTQIAASSGQQLAGMDQMADAMTSINEATHQSVSSLKKLESAMRNLQDLGERLNDVIEVL